MKKFSISFTGSEWTISYEDTTAQMMCSACGVTFNDVLNKLPHDAQWDIKEAKDADYHWRG